MSPSGPDGRGVTEPKPPGQGQGEREGGEKGEGYWDRDGTRSKLLPGAEGPRLQGSVGTVPGLAVGTLTFTLFSGG